MRPGSHVLRRCGLFVGLVCALSCGDTVDITDDG